MMNKTVLGVLSVLALVVFSCSKGEESSSEASSKPAEITQAKGVDGGGFTLNAAKVDFAWNVMGDKLSIKLKAPTQGWVGVGFNPTEEMKDANFIIGYVKDGEVTVLDQYGTSKRNHKEDKALGGANNVTDAAGTEKGNSTEIGFTIPLKSSDSLDGEIKPEIDQIVLLSYGKTDRLAQQHVAFARVKVNLSTGKYQVEKEFSR